MAKFDVPVTAKCALCGGKPITDDNPTEKSRIVCASCGKDLGSYGQLKKAAMAEVVKKAKAAFKGFGKRR